MSDKYIIEELKPHIDLAWFTPEGWPEHAINDPVTEAVKAKRKAQNVLVVVPPTLLVKMFGVPESVALPARVGDSIEFTAHGIVWRCKRVRRSAYFLGAKTEWHHNRHARWGTAAEIAADIGHVLETGALPKAADSSW